MNNPFEVLGLKGWAGPDEIRTAYRALVKQCHPDMIRDPSEKEAAQNRMVALNPGGQLRGGHPPGPAGHGAGQSRRRPAGPLPL